MNGWEILVVMVIIGGVTMVFFGDEIRSELKGFLLQKESISTNNVLAVARWGDVTDVTVSYRCGYINEWSIVLHDANIDNLNLNRANSYIDYSRNGILLGGDGRWLGDAIQSNYVGNTCVSTISNPINACYNSVVAVGTDNKLQPADSQCTFHYHLDYTSSQPVTTTTTIGGETTTTTTSTTLTLPDKTGKYTLYGIIATLAVAGGIGAFMLMRR